jgi:hypothetical protein
MNREKSVIYTDRPCYAIALLEDSMYIEKQSPLLFPKINVVGCSSTAGCGISSYL